MTRALLLVTTFATFIAFPAFALFAETKADGTEVSAADSKICGLDVGEFDGMAYGAVHDGGQWRIGIVNHAERLLPREVPLRIERHLTSDESFVLLEGKAELVLGENRPFPHVSLAAGKVYTVKQGAWHAVMTTPGAKLLVVENNDVSDANTERRELDLEGGIAHSKAENLDHKQSSKSRSSK